VVELHFRSLHHRAEQPGATIRRSLLQVGVARLDVRAEQRRAPLGRAEVGQRVLPPLEESVTLETLVEGLNALGIGPRDMISILQTIKTAGALQAELVVQ